VLLEVPPKALPSTPKPAISEVAAIPTDPVLLPLPGRRPRRRRGAEVLSAGLQVRFPRNRSKENRELGLGCIY